MTDTQQPDMTATQSGHLPGDPRRPDICSLTEHKDRQVSHIQRILMFHLNQRETDPRVVPALAQAWERLQNRLDRMLGNPEPKAQDPDKLKPAKKRAAAMPSSMDPSAKE